MLKTNFKYETRQLLRSRWLPILSILLIVLFAFAINNGVKKVEKRSADIEKAKTEMQEEYASLENKLDSIEKGFEVEPQYISRPLTVGNWYPRVAVKTPNELAFIATGQSDMFSDFKKPTLTYGNAVEDFTEMTSPVQLLFGSFDLAFVIVYLIPLLVIAFTYNVLSAERESGTLRLIAAQSIDISKWLLQKMFIRFLWMSIVVLISLVLLLAIFEPSITSTTLSTGFAKAEYLSSIIALILVYMLFWFALAYLVNLWIGTSAKNAVSLLGFWIVFVLLIPSVINQISSIIYPMPSRTQLVNDLRTMQADVTSRQDEILDNYLRDHPELALNDTTKTRSFVHKYVAAQRMMREEVKPLIEDFDNQLKRQQDWIDRFKWLSPAVLTQESLNEMAGTSTKDYDAYREQINSFSYEWWDYFLKLYYNDLAFAKADLKNIPQFTYKKPERKSSAVWILLGTAMLVFAVGFLIANRSKSLVIN